MPNNESNRECKCYCHNEYEEGVSSTHHHSACHCRTPASEEKFVKIDKDAFKGMNLEVKVNVEPKEADEWEVRFDEKFPPPITFYLVSDFEPVKSFIRSLLSAERKRVEEVVKGMKIQRPTDIEMDMTIEAHGLHGGMSIASNSGYNQALADILSALRKETKPITKSKIPSHSKNGDCYICKGECLLDK